MNISNYFNNDYLYSRCLTKTKRVGLPCQMGTEGCRTMNPLTREVNTPRWRPRLFGISPLHIAEQLKLAKMAFYLLMIAGLTTSAVALFHYVTTRPIPTFFQRANPLLVLYPENQYAISPPTVRIQVRYTAHNRKLRPTNLFGNY